MERFRLETVLDGPVIRETGSRGSSSLFSALSVAADEVPFDERELYGFLHFRIDTALKAQKRGHWSGGRVYNSLTGQSESYVPLSGTHLRQALSCIGLQPPEKVVVQGRYELRLDYALKAYAALKSRLETEPK
ncbi:hypothetical protein J7394_20605 [Ruegeria sp. R13_0]|uniref:hypothetical protein n=1 Tax=Ruegeria sp. R13_0 TaxID=2821099 RepID=UPI001ADB4C4A|nr:hypothetical protein [Ruegeria sp. R13_0]MBO9436618.1 hypothetical protein [Ruegeria sp. R13_0]